MTGALCAYVTSAAMSDFQPMKANFGILPALEKSGRRGKRERARAYGERAREDVQAFLGTSQE